MTYYICGTASNCRDVFYCFGPHEESSISKWVFASVNENKRIITYHGLSRKKSVKRGFLFVNLNFCEIGIVGFKCFFIIVFTQT
jgi:hypothetical protein